MPKAKAWASRLDLQYTQWQRRSGRRGFSTDGQVKLFTLAGGKGTYRQRSSRLEEYRLLVSCLKVGYGRVIEFGERIKGISYVDRPGAYAIIQDGSNSIALVRTPQGYLLPGGGVEPNEDFEVALQREIMEELGHESRIEEQICTAIQYLYSEAEHEHFKKVGHFFRARLMERICEPTEKDHELFWCSCDASIMTLAQEFQAWAVRQAFKITP